MGQSESIQSRTNEEREALLQEWHSSRLTKKEFCKQKSISYQTFIWWFGRRKQKVSKVANRSAFVPLVVDPTSGVLQVEIHLSNSTKVFLSGPVTGEILKAILKC